MTKEEYQSEIMRYSKQEIIEELAKMHAGDFEHETLSLLNRLEQGKTIKKFDEAERARNKEYLAYENYRLWIECYCDYVQKIAEREGIVTTDEKGAKKFSLADFHRVATKEEWEQAMAFEKFKVNAYKEWEEADKEAERKEKEAWGK